MQNLRMLNTKVLRPGSIPKALVCRRFSSNADQYQYLERSILPTMHFQKSLPRLPIPALEKTFQRHLNAMEAIFDQDTFAKIQRLSKEFQENTAKQLHEELVAVDNKNKHTSYISEYWFDMYLKSRLPLPLNFNPFMAFVNDPDPKYNNQLARATNMIVSACRFKRSLDANVLMPEVYHMNPAKTDTSQYRKVCRVIPPSLSWYGSYLFFKAFPLDMSQYSSLFSCTRIPILGRDQLHRFQNQCHVLVMRNGHFFAVDVLEKDGTIKAPSEIQASLAHILSMNLPPASNPVGVLTTLERDSWAKIRTQLVQEGNEKAFADIDSALFAVCLDDVAPKEHIQLAKSLLHSDGTNRWFDKSFTFIVQKDGLASMNFEHSWGDGVAVLRLMEEVHKDSCKNHWVSGDQKSSANGKSVRKIEFRNSPFLETSIREASASYRKTCDNLDCSTLEYTKMNRDYVKKKKISPDALFQAAIQIAYFRQCGKPAPTYESCSTAAFKHGRTETVRSATVQTKRLAEAVLSKKASPQELRKILEQCSVKHSELVKEAAMGNGFDRHLFALKSIAERRGDRLPNFFADPTYQAANSYVLSTSTLSTETVLLGGFGPVVPDGYGIGYNVGEKRFGCITTAYKDTRNVGEFIKCLEKSLDDLHNVLETAE